MITSEKTYGGYTFRFTATDTGIMVSMLGCHSNYYTLGTVAPKVAAIRDFLNNIINTGACKHLYEL